MVGTTIFTKMSALAASENALNLSQGFPDFPSDKVLIDLVSKAMNEGKNQYAPLAGIMSLREQLSAKIEKLYGTFYDPETEITITAGATQAIYTAITALVREEDEVIIITPAYDCYESPVQLAGAKPVFFQLQTPDYKIEWSELKKLVNRRTKMIIINTPHNPTGSVLEEDDLQQLEALVEDTNMMVLSDEVYEHIIFDGKQHQSICKYPKLAQRSIAVFSFGKTFHNTGWKMGYAVAPNEIMKEFRKVHQYNVFCVNAPIQHALAEYLKEESNYLGLPDMYQEKRDLFAQAVQGSKFKLIPCAGTYFQLLDYSEISDEGDVAFAERLTKENKIASVPVSVFYHKELDNKVLRFCFAKENDTIKRAGEILNSI